MGRFDNIQALRGIACLLVIAAHVHALDAEFGFPTAVLSAFKWFGFAGVDLFFVISGFIIATTNRKHFGRGAAIPGFLFRRFWRIYPLFWAAFALSFFSMIIVSGREVINEATRLEAIRWATLVPAERFNVFLGQAWTLTYEVMFYLAFGLLLVLKPRGAAIALAGWAAAVLIACAGPERNDPASTPLQPFVLEFLSGCIIAWLSSRGIARGIARGGRTAIGLGVLWAAIAIAIVRDTATEPYLVAMMSHRLRVLSFGPAAALIVYGFVALEGKWRVPRILLRTGDASYSLYLTHIVAMIVAKYVGYFIPHTMLANTAWVLAAFAAALGLGFAVHYLVERPLMNLAKSGPPEVRLPGLAWKPFRRFTWRS